MENEKVENKIEEQNVCLDLSTVGIGEDKPTVEAKPVIIVSYRIEQVNDKTGKNIGDKLILICEHPDVKDKTLDISGVKFLSKNKVKVSGLWVTLDSDKKLAFKSSLAQLLIHMRKRTIKEIVGEQVETSMDDRGYLLVKAY